MKSKIIIALIGIFAGVYSFAQGSERGGVGNGGCSICLESYVLGADIGKEVVLLGNSKVMEAIPLISDVKDFYKTAISRKVLPGNDREMNGRVAISYPDKKLTIIDVKNYKKLSKYKRLQIEIHELLVLMGIEVDGVYSWTNELINLFPNYERMERSEAWSCDSKHCMITYPKAEGGMMEWGRTSPIGICKYFNLGEVAEVTASRILFSKYHIAIINQHGHIIYNELLFEPTQVFESVKCKK